MPAVMGIETEFGIALAGGHAGNPVALSTAVVNAYGNRYLPDRPKRLLWDYDTESPLRDARGWDLSRSEADPSQLTADDYGMANLVLRNGARFYVDHAHPEYSSPECTNALDVALWDAAGDAIAAEAAALASTDTEIVLYKNNTDGKGASYGTHENYQLSRSTPFAELVRVMTPFFVTRPLVVGSGRVGLGQESRRPGFQISARADFFEAEVGLETTLRRPIINTRDEPHADPELSRRFHVIVGDANMSQFATYLKMAITAVVLRMVEADYLSDAPELADPVADMHLVSHDLTLAVPLQLRNGQRMTALEIQNWFLAKAIAFGAEKQVCTDWADVLEALASDRYVLRDRIDWIAKLALLETYRERDGLAWSDARLAAIDIQYADLRPDKGLALKLMQRGALRTLFSAADIAAAIGEGPTDTRAWFRGQCIARFSANVIAASWDTVIVETDINRPLARIATTDPLKGRKVDTQDLFAGGIDDFLNALGA